MFLRQSVLFAVVLLWNLTESAFDNDDKTIAHDNSSSSRLNENPLDGHSLLELQESATVNDTNRVDQLNEARGPTAHSQGYDRCTQKPCQGYDRCAQNLCQCYDRCTQKPCSAHYVSTNI